MRKMCLFLVLLFAGLLSAEEILNPQILQQKYRKMWKTAGFQLQQDGVLKVKGIPEMGEKKNGGQKLMCGIWKRKPEQKGKLFFQLEFEIRIVKNSGKVEVCIRNIDAAGKSLGYPGCYFKPASLVPEWKKFTRKIAVPEKADSAAFFIWARYLAADDDVQIRNIRIVNP